jgi:hypothetical protein
MRNNPKEWILFFQTPKDRVRFITNEIDSPTSLPYNKFISFVFENFNILNTKKFMDEVDSFQTVFLNGKTGNWEIKSPDRDTSKYTFDELYQIKKNKEEKNNKEINKGFIEHVWKNKIKKLIIR